MNGKLLYSIIILHYKQEKFLRYAVDSVLAQDYENIELIFADDHSPDLDADTLKKYIESQIGPNIKKVQYLINRQNIGIVKNINQAIQAASGAYIQFFAADDVLADSRVISELVRAAEEEYPESLIVSSQMEMCDTTLEKVEWMRTPPDVAERVNSMTPKQQFRALIGSCAFGMGATLVKKEYFDRYGYFDEQYPMLEDWPFYLRAVRGGVKIYYLNRVSLKHRDGGISSMLVNVFSPNSAAFFSDQAHVIEHEIFPYWRGASMKNRLFAYGVHRKACKDYLFAKNRLLQPRMREREILLHNPDIALYLVCKKLLEKARNKIMIPLKKVLYVFVSFVILALCFTLANTRYANSLFSLFSAVFCWLSFFAFAGLLGCFLFQTLRRLKK